MNKISSKMHAQRGGPGTHSTRWKNDVEGSGFVKKSAMLSEDRAPRENATELGIGIAESLLAQGADRILRELYDRS